MTDTSSLISDALSASTEVADSEPIPGDEAPAGAAEAAPEGDPAPEAAAEGEAGAEPAPAVEAPAAPVKRRGPIPFDRHQAVLTKARNEAAAKEAEYKARIEALSKYETPDHQAQLQFLTILEQTPERAIQILKQLDPNKFGKLSWAEQQQVAAAVAGKTEAAPAASAAGERPEPDALLPDGTLGYSAEGVQKLMEWREAKQREEYQKELKAIRDEIGPIKEEREAQAAYSAAYERQSVKLADARANWPEFVAHEAEMKAALAENPTWGLEDVYRAVVVNKIVKARDGATAAAQTAEDAARKKLIAETNARAKAGRASLAPGQLPAGASSEDTGAPRTTADMIREAARANAA